MAIRAGELRDVWTLQRPVTSRDTYGGQTVTWETVCTLRCSTRAMSGREYLLAQQMSAAASHELTTRYQAGITTEMRLVNQDGTRTLQITAVLDPDGRRRELKLMCVERV